MSFLRPFQRTALCMLYSAAVWAAMVSTSSALEAPTGQAVLTVSGDIGATNQGERAVFDHAMFSELGMHTTVTATPWHDETITFSGPLARSVLEAVDAQGDSVIAIALNDYEAEIPVADFYEYDVILATHANGEPMSVREHGPVFVIYPFDSDADLHQEIIYSRSVWQVNRLLVP
ncbi:molybdopterin-dependent oxidoreductase [Halomonas sp. CH40]